MIRLSDHVVEHWVTRGDLVVFTFALLFISIVFANFWHQEGHGAEAVVLVNGKRWARLNLFNNQDIYAPGPLGESHIQVRDGQIRFVDSPCPNKLCVHSGWLSQGGENATCLPNKISVQVLATDTRFDSINF